MSEKGKGIVDETPKPNFQANFKGITKDILKETIAEIKKKILLQNSQRVSQKPII